MKRKRMGLGLQKLPCCKLPVAFLRRTLTIVDLVSLSNTYGGAGAWFSGDNLSPGTA